MNNSFKKKQKKKYDIDKLFKTNKTKEIINLPEKGESENFIKKLIKFIKNIIWKR